QAMARHGLVDHRTDVYALGAVLYELLTGRPVITGEDKQEMLRQIAFEEPIAPRKINAEIPVDLETIVLSAIQKNPSERYANAQDLAEDIRRWIDQKPLKAKRDTRIRRARCWCRRNPAIAALGLVILLATMGLSGTTALFWVQKGRAET